ncbi:MAG TPA: hypothetical protein DHV51_01915 [Opitutae bacterium]|nr:hypothetical protein [Opitutae bacterium]
MKKITLLLILLTSSLLADPKSFSEIIKSIDKTVRFDEGKTIPTNKVFAGEKYLCDLQQVPMIFHYNKGGDDSNMSFIESIATMTENGINTLPQILQETIKNGNFSSIQCYVASTHLLQPLVNYFMHAWAMPGEMKDNKTVNVSTGIYRAKNIKAFGDQIGIDKLVSQEMFFHGGAFSGNVAKFEVTSYMATGYFLSVNEETKAAILIYWIFLCDSI